MDSPKRFFRSLAIALWLLPLLLPAAVLRVVVSRLGDGYPLGKYSRTLLALVASWFACCLLVLALARFRRWLQSHCAHLAAAYCSAALGLLAAESLCRLQLAVSWDKQRRIARRTEYAPDLGWRLVPGQDGVGRFGWRGPDRETAKPQGCYRIVCVGDSTTHGYSCPPDHAWPQQLEALINADVKWRSAHDSTEVINLGVPGYGTDQERLALRKYGLAFHPDLVILHLCINDFADVCFDYDWRMAAGVIRYKPLFGLENGRLVLKRRVAPPPRYLSGRLYDPRQKESLGWRVALAYKLGRFLETREPKAVFQDRNSWPIRMEDHEEYTRSRPLVWALVRAMAADAQAAGSAFLVTLSPAQFNAHDAMSERQAQFLDEYHADAAAAGLTALDCVAQYFSEGGDERFVAADDLHHLNEQGNALIARHILHWLQGHI